MSIKTGGARASKPFADTMTWIAGGRFVMGSDVHYPEEAPLRATWVDGFWIDTTPVTNRQYAQFVAATGHVTMAEIAPDPKDYPGLIEELARAGSLVFHQPSGSRSGVGDPNDWWRFEHGADWRHPHGRDTDHDKLDLWDHPVVHIAYADAIAYAKWAGKDLPTEAEFEYAARGGLEGQDFAWGSELAPEGKILANYWHGLFPISNLAPDGWARTSPVGTFPANGYGLCDMIGNVWEWTRDWWSEAAIRSPNMPAKACCTVRNPRGGRLFDSFDPAYPSSKIGRKVLKGGSHLCAENYCRRYRPAARQPQTIDTSTSHIGFRCVSRRN